MSNLIYILHRWIVKPPLFWCDKRILSLCETISRSRSTRKSQADVEPGLLRHSHALIEIVWRCRNVQAEDRSVSGGGGVGNEIKTFGCVDGNRAKPDGRCRRLVFGFRAGGGGLVLARNLADPECPITAVHTHGWIALARTRLAHFGRKFGGNG